MMDLLESAWPYLQTFVEVAVVLAVLIVIAAISPDLHP